MKINSLIQFEYMYEWWELVHRPFDPQTGYRIAMADLEVNFGGGDQFHHG